MKNCQFLACIILFQSCFFMGPSSRARLKKAALQKPFDVVIVPGLPLYNGKWDTLLKARILWSEFLYRKGYAKKVLYSGNAVYTPWIESRSMALYAGQLGIPKEDILLDTIAEHGTENLFYGYLIAKQNGYDKIALATDPFQCAMLHRFARKNFRNKIFFIPVIYDSISDRTGIKIEIDSSACRRSGFVCLQDRENYRKRLKGTRGKNIGR
jgi:uncharacterized SAM-binding protein YcdF (DUF218 family)